MSWWTGEWDSVFIDGDGHRSVIGLDVIQEVDGFLSFPQTGSWASFREVKVPVRLDAGENTIALGSIGYSGPNLDYMALSPIGPVGHGEVRQGLAWCTCFAQLFMCILRRCASMS